MGDTTKRLQIPFPSASDPNNVPSDLQRLANLLDSISAAYSQNTLANRPAAAVAGRLFLATDTLTVYYDTGSAWITLNLAATVTTKGDLLVASAAGTLARLGVGADGQVLQAMAGAGNGLQWAPVLGQALGLAGAGQATRYVGATSSGAPTSGSFQRGDCVIAQNGVEWICTGSGSPGNWTASYAAALGLPVPTAGSTQATRWIGATADGPPSSGYYTVGDWCLDLRGVQWICTANGSPGQWTNTALSRPFCHIGATTNQSVAATDKGAFVQFSVAQVLRGGFGFDANNNAAIVPRSGLYRQTMNIDLTAGTTPWKGRTLLASNDSSLPPGSTTSGSAFGYKPDNTDWMGYRQSSRALNSGDVVRMWINGSTGAGSLVGDSTGYTTYFELEYMDQ